MCGARFQSNGPQFRRCKTCSDRVNTWKTVGEDTEMEEYFLMESEIGGYGNKRNVFGDDEQFSVARYESSLIY